MTDPMFTGSRLAVERFCPRRPKRSPPPSRKVPKDLRWLRCLGLRPPWWWLQPPRRPLYLYRKP